MTPDTPKRETPLVRATISQRVLSSTLEERMNRGRSTLSTEPTTMATTTMAMAPPVLPAVKHHRAEPRVTGTVPMTGMKERKKDITPQTSARGTPSTTSGTVHTSACTADTRMLAMMTLSITSAVVSRRILRTRGQGMSRGST